jgi:hypothetical protein
MRLRKESIVDDIIELVCLVVVVRMRSSCLRKIDGKEVRGTNNFIGNGYERGNGSAQRSPSI